MNESTPSDEPAATEPTYALSQAVVVLVEPWEPGNVGAICRAMNNMGAHDLRMVVESRAQRERLKMGDARRFATHARPILDAATFHDSLASAQDGCHQSVAFSARTGRFRLPRHTFDEGMQAAAGGLSTGRVALMFGTEERGLSRDHLESATDILAIPMPGPHKVLNLGQSVLVALWELARAHQAVDPALGALRTPAPKATLDEREGLRDDWDRALTDMGYGRRGRGTLHDRILRRLMELVDRAGLERDDASMMRGLAKRVFRLTGDRTGLPPDETPPA